MTEKKKRLGSNAFDESPLGSLIRDTRPKKIKENTSADTGKREKKNLPKAKKLEKKEYKKSTYKHTNIQTKEGRISEVGERATFYVRPELLTEIRILSIKTKEKNLSELVNEALEDIIKKYKGVLLS